jgi:hypothetical protein
MDEAERRRDLHRADSLEAEAREHHETAERLDRLATEVEGRLDPVLAALTPRVWAGRAADEARAEAAMAAETLVLAAGELRSAAALARAEAVAGLAHADLLRSPAGAHGGAGTGGRP